jgi:Ca2+-binding RTX toxin-like protein
VSAERISELRCFGRQPSVVIYAATPFDDRIRGTRGVDVIVTLGGNDVVTGLSEDDVACTGPGNDRVVDERGRAFADIRINLGDGDDRATVVDHIGKIRGGAGDDTIVFALKRSAADVAPGPGNDMVRAVDVRHWPFGTPCVRLGSATGPVRVNLARGRARGQGRDRLVNIRCVVGSRYNDVLTGTDWGDEIDGAGGLDLVRAGAGNDEVSGGYFADRADELYLGPGNDTGAGGYGWDRIYGGPGSDAISGNDDGDYLDGGTGDDYLYAGLECLAIWESSPWALIEMLTNRAPNEVFGRAGNDFLAGDRGNDRLDGGAGADSGTGGYRDGRIDWIASVERFDECNSRPIRSSSE